MEVEKHIPGQENYDSDLDEDTGETPADDQREDDPEDEESEGAEEADQDEESDKPQEEDEEESESEDKEEKEESEEDESGDQKPKDEKKRSIYDALKGKKNENKQLKQAISEKDQKIADLEKQLADARTQKDKDAAQGQIDAEIEAIAEDEGISLEAAKRIYEKGAARSAQAQEEKPEPASEEKNAEEESDEDDEEAAEDQREAEDQQTLSELPDAWKDSRLDLPEISDPKEKEAVEAEILRLSHLAKYHDKSLAYILFEEQDNLKKLVSPKKPSFESAAGSVEGEEAEGDLEISGSTTPEQLQNVMSRPQKGKSMTVRKSR